RGTVRIASADHRADPLIDFRYFSHPDDLATLAAGAQRVAKVFETPTFRADHMPYGGRRGSGDAREGPAAAALEMTYPKLVITRVDPA
ncbi:MAG: GMC oxidoreductase, partial [Miltoncostaeaceae bacterium]